MKKGNLRAQIRQMCCLGLPAETLMPRLLPLLRQLVPAESAGFFWVDSSGHMQNLFAERMLPTQKMQLFFDEFYEGGEFDFRKSFRARAAAEKDVSVARVDSAFQRTAYYNEILRDLDAHHVLHGIVRDHGATLGQVSLYRPQSDPGFECSHEEDLHSVLHYVAHAVGAGIVSHSVSFPQQTEQMFDTPDDAVLLADTRGAVLHASESARRLLVQAVGEGFSPESLPRAHAATADLLKRVVGLLADDTDAVPMLSQNTRWGRLTLRAYRLDGESSRHTSAQAEAPVAVRVTRQEPMLLRFANAMRALDLSPQMQEIAVQLARGRSNQEIAQEMSLSANTVNYHVKALFTRLGTHGRAETVQHILGNAAP
jgi:DNA-binding CsgD family transcriptional regulator